MKIFFQFLFISLLIQLRGNVYSQCLEGNCINGYGKLKCSCGYIFEGQFIDGVKVYGTLTKDDLVYVGEFNNDVAEGLGEIHFIDSTWYEGSFVNSSPHGFGSFHFPSGAVYTGQMKEGSFSGLGVLKWPTDSNSRVMFKIGEFANDMLHGYGVTLNNNFLQFGHFDNDEMNGFGLTISAENEVKIGRFKKGRLTREAVVIETEKGKNVRSVQQKMGKSTYEAIADLNTLVIRKFQDRTLLLVVVYANEKLYVSNTENPLVGRIIDMEGNINSAAYTDKDGEIVIEIVEDK